MPPSSNKAYALHSLTVVRATPNRGEKAAATSHKQNVYEKKYQAVFFKCIPFNSRN